VDTIASLALLLIVFAPLERAFPAHRQAIMRRGFGTDLLFFLGFSLVFAGPAVAVLVVVHRGVDLLPLAFLRGPFETSPFWLQCLVAFALCDVALYWGHRFAHRSPLLWRFHRVHHTSRRMDWLAAYREHPLDHVYTRVVENLPVMLLGFSLEAVAGFVVFRGLWAIFIHSNVSLDVGPLRYLLGAPRLHHWHHERTRGGAVNFANVSPLMDLLFGTFYDPACMPARYGADGPGAEHGYLRQLLAPARGA